MFDALTRHAVHVLREAGMTLKQIAEKRHVSEKAVRRILKEPPIEMPAAGPTARERSVGRPSTTAKYTEQVAKILAEENDLPSVEVLHRVRTAGYQGGKSALYSLVAELRPKKTKAPMVRFEGVAGEFSQHDFGQVHVKYGNGTLETIHFFASRLKYSRFSKVILVRNERIESLIRALIVSFEAFGGVPLVGVFDNPKTIAYSHIGAEVEWNPTFAQVAIDLRFGVELCTPTFANQKGSVENLVKWVKGSFFKVRRFLDREDLEQQLAEWHDEVNETRPSRATKVTVAARMEEERKRLRPLVYASSEYPLRFPITVGPTGVVEHDGVRYSMPAKTIGMPGTLFLYPTRVKVVARDFVVDHPRTPETGRTSYIPEHRSDLLAAVSGDRGRLYMKRQQIFELGPVAVEMLTEIIHARPRTWKGDVEALYELLRSHGPKRVLAAIEEAYLHGLFAAEHVRNLLREGA